MKKRVFITGGSRGIGQATAYEFSKNNWEIIFTYNKNKAGAKATAQKCKELGATDVKILKLNITKDKSIRSTVKKIGKIDILINNAGVLWEGRIKKMKFNEVENVLRSNLEGLIKLTLEFLPNIKRSIVNVASRAGKIAHKDSVVYCASKFGVRGFTKGLADEMKQLKIYSVNPGNVATQMTDFEGVSPEKVGKIIYKTATGKTKIKSGGDIDVWKLIGG